MLRTVTFLSLLGLLSLSTATAQAGYAPSPGELVRLTTSGGSVLYYMVDWAPPTVTVRNRVSGEIIAIPSDMIQQISVRNGKESRSESALQGFIVGALLGGVIGGGIGFAGGDDTDGLFAATATDKAIVGALGLGTLGGVVGSVVGLARPATRWEPVASGVRWTSLRQSGGFGVGLSLPI